MKCMCAQTRPRFILSSERVFGGMEFEPMLTPRGKSPLPENVPRGGSNPRRCGQRAQALPTELFRPPPPPSPSVYKSVNLFVRSSICLYIYYILSTCPLIYPCIRVSIYLSIHRLPTYLSVYLPVHLSNQLPTCLSVCLSVQPQVCLNISLSIDHSVQ